MRLAIFGQQGSFDWTNIGGTNSLIRRLSTELRDSYNISINLVLYDAGNDFRESHHKGIDSIYRKSLNDAIDLLHDYDHVLTIYLPPTDILRYANFVYSHREEIKFHLLYQIWLESYIKREFWFFLRNMVPINGVAFAVSPRLRDRLNFWRSEADMLWPPVPEDYFVSQLPTPDYGETRVTFIGRLDPEKGIYETINIFKELAALPGYKPVLYGTYWSDDQVAADIHEQLQNQEKFEYNHIEFEEYSNEVDIMVRKELKRTDIFVQPYRKMSSSIDTPLLVLESMASLTPVITRPLGELEQIYGKSCCLIDGKEGDFCKKALDLITTEDRWLREEQDRIREQNSQIRFNVSDVAQSFYEAVNRDE